MNSTNGTASSPAVGTGTGRSGNTSAAWAALLQAAARPQTGEQLSGALRTAFSLRIDVASDIVGCSITEIDGGQFRTPVWSNDVAIELDHTQYDAGKGPCIDAARQQRVVSWGSAVAGGAADVRGASHSPIAGDVGVASDVRYPFFAQAALQRGVFSSLSIPLRTGSQPAALNLYGGAAATFQGARPHAVADLLARCIGRLLLDSAAGSAFGSTPGIDSVAGRDGSPTVSSAASVVDADALAAARLQHEQVVRAQHALMSSRGLSAQDAFTVLAELSRTRRRAIADVARSVLSQTASEPESFDV